jgi:hypothetical protein
MDNEDSLGNFRFTPDIPIYADGSGYYGDDPCLATAGLGLLQHIEGKITKSVQLCLPAGIPPTAAAAEHICVALANKYTAGPFTLVTDCGSVYKSGSEGAAYALNWARPMAGFWFGVRFQDLSVRKTKAHRTLKQAQEDGDPEDWLGNDLADGLAKKAASFGTPSAHVAEERQTAFLRRVQFYHLVAGTLDLWKAVPPSGAGPVKVKKNKGGDNQGHDLVWLPFLHQWSCQICFRQFRTTATSRKTKCQWKKSGISTVVSARAAGHSLWVCNYLYQPGSLLFCNKCGCYAQVKAVGLLQTCIGSNHSQRYLLTKFIQQGLHPTSRASLGKPRRMPGAQSLVFPSGERTHEEGGRARPGVQNATVQAGSIPAQEVWNHTTDDAEEAFLPRKRREPGMPRRGIPGLRRLAAG